MIDWMLSNAVLVWTIVGIVALVIVAFVRRNKPIDELQATTTEGDAETFNDVEVRGKFKHGSVNYVVRARGNGKYMIRIRGRNTRSVLLESDNDYDSVEQAEEILALIHDETVKGNVARVHKPAEDAEDDVRD